MDLATLNKQIEDLESQQRRLRLQLEPLYQERAEANAPFQVGDVAVSRSGRRARVARITPGYSPNSPTITGARLRRDGSDGRPITMLSIEHWQKEGGSDGHPAE